MSCVAKGSMSNSSSQESKIEGASTDMVFCIKPRPLPRPMFGLGVDDSWKDSLKDDDDDDEYKYTGASFPRPRRFLGAVFL